MFSPYYNMYMKVKLTLKEKKPGESTGHSVCCGNIGPLIFFHGILVLWNKFFKTKIPHTYAHPTGTGLHTRNKHVSTYSQHSCIWNPEVNAAPLPYISSVWRQPFVTHKRLNSGLTNEI